jgi:hypothetical protein
MNKKLGVFVVPCMLQGFYIIPLLLVLHSIAVYF